MSKLESLFKTLYVKGLVFTVLLYLSIPKAATINYLCDSNRVGNCLDESWVTAINLAIQKQLIFGQDFAFTYGPLGFLAMRNDVGINHIYFILFDLLIFINFFFIFRYVLKYHYKIYSISILIVSVWLIPTFDIGFVMLLISIFWLNYSQKYSLTITILNPLLFTALMFFIKLNTSFIAIIIYYLYLSVLFFQEKEMRIYRLPYFFALPVLIYLLSLPLKVSLSGYVRTSLSIISSYNEAMNQIDSLTIKATIIAIFCILTFWLIIFKDLSKKYLALIFTCFILNFVLFKQSFVRGQIAHIVTFFSFFPFLIFLSLIFLEINSKLKIISFMAISLICVFTASYIKVSGNLPREDLISSINRSEYFSFIFNQNKSGEVDAKWNALPLEVKNEIGQKNVDIIPWEVNLIFYNKLNYNPRPIFQSYVAYDPYLIRLNGEKYNSENAPDYVIFSNQTIDGRYAMFDDEEVKLALIKNYSIQKYFTINNLNYLLFKKSNHDSLNISPIIKEENIEMGEDYIIKDTNKAYLMKFDIDYSLLGKAMRFAYQPLYPIITFTLEDGSTKNFKVVIPILKGGVIINPFIENEKDFLNFSEGNWQSKVKKITKFRIEPLGQGYLKRLSLLNYQNKIKISVSEINVTPKNN